MCSKKNGYLCPSCMPHTLPCIYIFAPKESRKSILQCTFLCVTKVESSSLETCYYIKPICNLEIPTKWIKISETNFLVFIFKLHKKL